MNARYFLLAAEALNKDNIGVHNIERKQNEIPEKILFDNDVITLSYQPRL